ncbi:LamG domain-containing protein [Candidatus Poribacteria bacterium]|nr:LamG domain-containing protein [Candidatus Poribacteria bacterium]
MTHRQFSKHVCCLGILILLLTSLGNLYAAAIDKDTIEVAYLFDEGSGNVAKDISGNGRDGNITGAKRVQGKFGKALEYDGTDDNLIVSGYNGIGGTDPRTTVFWIKTSTTRDHSWVKWGINSAGQKYYIRSHVRGTDCNLRVEVNGGNNFGTDNVCDGEWHHCAVVFPKGGKDVKDHDLYVNGKLQVKEGTAHGMDTNVDTQVVNIGHKLANHQFLLGTLDEVAIFNVELSLKQINTIRNTGLKSALHVDSKGKLATRWGMLKRD